MRRLISYKLCREFYQQWRDSTSLNLRWNVKRRSSYSVENWKCSLTKNFDWEIMISSMDYSYLTNKKSIKKSQKKRIEIKSNVDKISMQKSDLNIERYQCLVLFFMLKSSWSYLCMIKHDLQLGPVALNRQAANEEKDWKKSTDRIKFLFFLFALSWGKFLNTTFQIFQ